MYRRLFKPLIDFAIALIGCLVLIPIMILLAIVLAVSFKGNPFFLQSRPGKNEKLFKIIKFRTMKDKRNESGNLLPDEQRLTPTGKFVRRTSLDEIPQLINVLKGDMSLIGPRPLLPEYIPLYTREQRKRHRVKPGITGWAQVNGRNELSWEQKHSLDIWYVENVNFVLDLKILLMTIKKVVASEGINSKGVATAEKFKGD